MEREGNVCIFFIMCWYIDECLRTLRVGVHGFFKKSEKKRDALRIIVACKSGENVLHVDTTYLYHQNTYD